GRTPYQHDFVWYGKYDVEVRKEGYETLKTRGIVEAPWWQWVPLDLLTEIAPIRFKDRQLLTYTLRPISHIAVDPQVMMRRAAQMQSQLESSEHTHPLIAPPVAATMASS